MRLRCFALLLLPALLPAQNNTLTPKEISDGWILLFDGTSNFAWTSEGATKWTIADGSLVPSGDAGWLRTNSVFADFVLKCDFRTDAEGNSGLFLRSARQGAPHETGYELQIFNKHEKFPTGSLVNHAAARAQFKPGVWNTMEVQAEGDHFVVTLNGAQVLNARDKKSPTGHIGLQYNKDKKIEFRNVKLLPLGLKQIFDGKSLSGWRKVEPPKPPAAPPEWTVRDGVLHVEKGPGQIETEGTWADFVLQIDVKVNSQDPTKHPNSGVFLRGEPNGYWSGYESQIRNEFSDGDRNKPVDFGTGGIYRLQPTRRVMGTDNEFFTKTIVARGRHIAVWVNGYAVSDFEDQAPEGNNVRAKEAKISAGAISLQAHDPTTNLDFKNIRIVEIPR